MSMCGGLACVDFPLCVLFGWCVVSVTIACRVPFCMFYVVAIHCNEECSSGYWALTWSSVWLHLLVGSCY